MTQSPHVLAYTPWVGQPSNVWMYRQFKQLDDQIRTIVTWEYLNEDQFPLPNTEMRLVPPQFAEPLRGLPRTFDSILNQRTGGERQGIAFDRWLRKQVVDAQADAVLGQFGHYAMTAESACRSLAVPVFAHFHGFDISVRLAKKRYLRALQRHWHRFAGMIVVAQYQRDLLLQMGYPDESIALIPCGAPAVEIHQRVTAIRRSQPRRDEHFVFLFIGRFAAKKDPLSVLRAFQRCHRKHPHARLRMGGYGPLEQPCKDWVAQQEPELGAAIEWTGTLRPDQVVEELAHANTFVQHSRVGPDGDKEGWPVAIGEAMGAGLPIIATRHAGIVDQVIEGHNGLLCDEGDWEQMGDDMIQLAGDPEGCRAMGEASLERGRQFDSNGQIEQLRQFMNNRIQLWQRSGRSRRAA